MPQMQEQYQWPLSFVHRGDLQRIFLDRLNELGVDMRLGERVLEVDENFAARVKVTSGQWYEGDVVIAADGVKSRMRALMAAKSGITDRSTPTGDAAYRLQIPRPRLSQEPEVLAILDDTQAWRVIGPGGHIMMYPISPRYNEKTGKTENQLLNVGILHPKYMSTPDEESWTSTAPKTDMLTFCQGWAPTIQKMLALVPGDEVLDWTLNTHAPLQTWIVGSVALIGDACHPM